MNARQSFAQWLRLSPERYGGSSHGDSGLLAIVEYFLMAIEEGVFEEFGVIWRGDTITYGGQKYLHPYASSLITLTNQADRLQPFESLFQSLLGFSPKVFTVWGDLSETPRGKFAQAIFCAAR